MILEWQGHKLKIEIGNELKSASKFFTTKIMFKET